MQVANPRTAVAHLPAPAAGCVLRQPPADLGKDGITGSRCRSRAAILGRGSAPADLLGLAEHPSRNPKPSTVPARLLAPHATAATAAMQPPQPSAALLGRPLQSAAVPEDLNCKSPLKVSCRPGHKSSESRGSVPPPVIPWQAAACLSAAVSAAPLPPSRSSTIAGATAAT